LPSTHHVLDLKLTIKGMREEGKELKEEYYKFY
jgi:hypothetical protein